MSTCANGSKLEVTFLGYQPGQIIAGKPDTYTIALHPQSEMLDEVVKVAFGSQKKESVIGAISGINADELKVPVGNLSSAIAGKIAGAVVMQRSAEPGQGAADDLQRSYTVDSGSAAARQPRIFKDPA